MDISLSPTLLIFFLLSGLAYLVFLFKKGKFSPLKFQINQSETRNFGIFSISICALLSLRGLLPITDALVTAVIFFVSIAIPFLLMRLNFATEALQVVLLAAVIALSAIFHTGLTAPMFLSALLGLLTYKILENILFSKENKFEDVAPACAWLAVQVWLTQTSGSNPQVDNILLSCLSISMLMKMIPSTFLAGDLFAGKKIVLSLSAGLILLIILNKILLLPKLALLAGLFAAGLIFVLGFARTSKDDDEDIKRLFYCVGFLATVGMLTVGATRLFGDLGLIVLLPTCLLCGASNSAILASVFWSSRLLIQAFVSTNVANVTGINLMHTYCSGALYFGFLAILFLLAILSIKAKDWLATIALLLTALIAPPVIMYLFHEESAGSFLIASIVSSISLVSFFPFFYKGQNDLQQDNLMLVPMMMTTVGLLFAPLIQIGNESTVASRMQLVSAVGVAFLLIFLAVLVINKMSASRNPVSVPRD
jgi:hypothetical protein